MGQKRVDGLLASMEDIENSVRQSCLAEQLSQLHAQTWIFLAWFQNEGVATRQGDREHPHRDHCRKIKRSDPGHYSERLAKGEAVDLRADLFGIFAFQQLGNAAGEFNNFKTAHQLTFGIIQNFSVLGADQQSQSVLFSFYQLPETEEHA